MKKSNKFLAIVILMIALCGVGNANAQYINSGFAKWSGEVDGTAYLVISDPLSDFPENSTGVERAEIQAKWVSEFKVSANDQAGFRLMSTIQSPQFYYNRYSSLSHVKEAIQETVLKFKEFNTKIGKPFKIIYVNLN